MINLLHRATLSYDLLYFQVRNKAFSPGLISVNFGFEFQTIRRSKINAMDTTTVDTVKVELLEKNPMFRDLVQQHQSFEKRLSELAELTYPNDEELLEEATLKKRKLMIKDEMYSMMQEYSSLH